MIDSLNRFFRKFSLLAYIIIFSGIIPEQTFPLENDPGARIDQLLNKIAYERNDSLRISMLTNLARFYNEYLHNDVIADSLSEEAIQIAESSRKYNLILHAYNSYIEADNFISSKSKAKALSYAGKAGALCKASNNPRVIWRTIHNIATANLESNRYTIALGYSRRSIDLAERLRDTTLMALSYLDHAKSLEGENRKKDALDSYLLAVKLAEQKGSKNLQIKCYHELSRFFQQNKLLERAAYYKNIQKELIDPGDSVALMWVMHDLQLIYRYLDPASINTGEYLKVIDFAIRANNNKLKEYELTGLRSLLIDTDRFNELYRLYHDLFPEELEKFLYEDPSQYYKLKAFFKIVERQNDSADYYFRRAEYFIKSKENLLIIATFYNRYGQFLKKWGKPRDAIEKFRESFEYASRSTFFVKKDYMLTASMHLDSLYRELGDFRNAYYYSKMNKDLADSINILATKEEVITVSLNYEAMQRELAFRQSAELEKQKTESIMKQRRTERFMLSGGIIFLILISYFIYRNYVNQKRSNIMLDAEKKKSDNLLLNILPYETAEELKHTGEAKAKKFEEVTVMFTDFKDFTLASENMSAEELVRLIHFYFTEFDKIITGFGIEKIKIIGDSYMCVGGLPISNETHAVDVVSAAIELQSFMNKEKIRRTGRNEPFFELRIGIHSGPVVAGIVGTKKFAYDIWGDTVNTASRMENTCETGRVNISGTTHAKVKDIFTCSYRGKVKAKNKGEIDMYFVNPPDKNSDTS